MNSMRPPGNGKAADEQGPATEFEGEIREIIRRDVAPMRKPPPETAAGGETGSLSSLISRISVTSVAEIEKLISELQILRDFLQNESRRVQREIAGYAQLSQAAMSSTRVIADSLAQWKSAVDAKRTIENGTGGGGKT